MRPPSLVNSDRGPMQSDFLHRGQKYLLNILCAHTHGYVRSASYCQLNGVCACICTIPPSMEEEEGVDRLKDQPYTAWVPQFNDMAAITIRTIILLLSSPLSPWQKYNFRPSNLCSVDLSPTRIL